MDLSIVIVNYRSSRLLKSCLASIERSRLQLAHETIVVDNDSHDDGLAEVQTAHPEVTFIEAGSNLGFAGGNNTGIRAAQGQAVCLLNPDTEVGVDALQILYDRLMSEDDLGIVGPKIRFADGSLQTKVLPKKAPDLEAMFYEMFYLGKLLPGQGRLNSYYGAAFDFDAEQGVGQVSGACLMIKKEVIDRIGPMDQRFFLYFEETDWCLRAERAGYRILYVPTAEIMHYEGGSAGGSRQSIETFYESELYFFSKNYGTFTAGLLYLLNLTGFAFRLLISPLYLLKPRTMNKPRRNLWALIYHLDLRHLAAIRS